ncbi:MAG: response regulator [Candidatus Marinimicrobia bacterium]|jgi:DNA-binding response OmpR family regulator|nr:response regulator [Candidatus Neomarinimicrobiota bacterium]MBT7580987.1 response regulator [Candidatus Neomarinimicrobiota bacterium]
MRLLLIEDDILLGKGLVKALENEAFSVDWSKNGKESKAMLNISTTDVVILDLGLPDIDGIDLLNQIRGMGFISPVLILTARDSTEDKIKGLNKGADDYLIKPFALEELLARLRALERRLTTVKTSLLQWGELELDSSKKLVKEQGRIIELSRHEYMLLKMLMERPETIHDKQKIESNLYNYDEIVGSNTIEVHIHNLRKKIKANQIKTIRGLGYTMNKQ